ncbi:MAG: precorrin-6y C5,15-methyltransferase (decarboxylating) subunit CbiE [Synergistaceae bacterium]|jgi:precorrin-6Y C5,15-methyltransferase (decarboxylating)|nr:precorrin-6y C5,15-methyltransferase (decarboxylating) subunit CbiE [Synergistaceae bacterium]
MERERDKNGKDLRVVSVGPGDTEHLTPAAERALRTADCLFIAKRHLESWTGSPAKESADVAIMGDLDDALSRVEKKLEEGSVAVAVSGDAGVFSLLPRLRKRFPNQEISVVPGVSSLQSLCAALGETWENATIASVHGRDMPPSKVAGMAAHNGKTIFFCGPDRGPAWLCRVLSEREIDVEVAVGERLSYPDERVTRGRPSQLAEGTFDPLSVVRVSNPEPLLFSQRRPEDSEFLRSESRIPMTGEEVRTMALDRLRLSPDSVVWDIGAGTGSVSVACARLCPFGEVHAAERLSEAVSLLRANKAKFRSYNLFIHEGGAAESLGNLPRPTHVFVGGSGGELRQILEHVGNLSEDIRVVVSGVTLNTIAVASQVLSGPGFYGMDALQVSISRSKPVRDSLIMAARNPVTLLSAWAGRQDGRGKGSPSS